MALSFDLQSCVKCPDGGPTLALVLFIFLFIISILAMAFYFKCIEWYPEEIPFAVALVSIVLAHSQVMFLIAEMKLDWPISFSTFYKTFGLVVSFERSELQPESQESF